MKITPPYSSNDILLDKWSLVTGVLYRCDSSGGVQLCVLWEAPNGMLFHEKGYINAKNISDEKLLNLIRETSQLVNDDKELSYNFHLKTLLSSQMRKVI